MHDASRITARIDQSEGVGMVATLVPSNVTVSSARQVAFNAAHVLKQSLEVFVDNLSATTAIILKCHRHANQTVCAATGTHVEVLLGFHVNQFFDGPARR